MHRHLSVQRGLPLIVCLLLPAFLHSETTSDPVSADTCAQRCVYHFPIVVYDSTPVTVTRLHFTRTSRRGAYLPYAEGIVINDVGVPLYNVTVEVQYYYGETVVHTDTVPLTLPALLPGMWNSFDTCCGSFNDSRYLGVRAKIVAWQTESPVAYASLTIVSAEVEIRMGGSSCEYSIVEGLVRNDHPFVLTNVQMRAKAVAAEPDEWGIYWFTQAQGTLYENDQSFKVMTTIEPGQTLPYSAGKGACEGVWGSEWMVDVAAQGAIQP